MINHLSGGKVTLALFVIIILLVTAFSVTVVIYTAEIKSLKAELKQEQLQVILYKDSLAQANTAIDKQNKEIEKVKIDNDKARDILKQELDNITRDKDRLIKQAVQSLSQDNSCENRLRIINNTQMEFLNGK
ncbi:hypothetical protein [Mucispirillum schaedleri]|uniref:hypothetical protein n=1 Tax=Mucispirillum schaedleri TaxID=248039 RepID=UPI001F592176|nr:hypothetical protein [Mucispirillum schaedleri]